MGVTSVFVFLARFIEHVIHTHDRYKQRVLTPGHQGGNDLHSLCRIGMVNYLLNDGDDHDNNNDNNNNNNKLFTE